jgi:uncharacterized protein YigE (DUF2233 family)
VHLGHRADVIESLRFADNAPSCRFATQSGPMLVIDGDLHPRFRQDSDSLNVRNGVGVSDDGRSLVLAISDEPVNFHHFARFFRDEWEHRTRSISMAGSRVCMRRGSTGPTFGFPVGPIIGIIERDPSVDGTGGEG